MKRAAVGVLLGLLGVGLALAVGLFALRLVGRDEVVLDMLLAPCTPASGDWQELTIAFVRDYRTPCARFYWDVAPDREFYNLIRLNNYGLNDTNLTVEKPEGVFRILILGDSFPQGWQVKLEQGFPGLLEEALNRASSVRIEVINMGVDTYGTDRELMLFATLGWQFEPDLVLLSFYTGNDFKDNSFALSSWDLGWPIDRPLFTLDHAGRLQLHNAPVLVSGRLSGSPAADWLAQQADQQQPMPEIALPRVPRVIGTAPRALEYPVDLGVYLPDDEYWANAWALTESLILQLRRLVEAQGARFGVFILPDRRAVQNDDWDATVSLFPFLRESSPFGPADRVEAFLKAQGIPALNLTYTLRGWMLSNINDRLYYLGDGHFNANGHAVTAQRLEFWLQEAGFVPS